MSIKQARAATEQRLPGLVAALQARGLMPLERAEPAELCQLFRELGGTGLLVPEELGGLGASPSETVDILRTVGSLCPSLAVMMTMHHHTIATIVQLGGIVPAANELMGAIAGNRMLVASAFAEGKPGAAIFNASLKARPVDGGFLLRGSKKPCTMSHGMDVIVAGVAREAAAGPEVPGFAVIFAESGKIARERFWQSPVLAAADSNTLVFDDVFVPEDLVLLAEGENAEQIAESAQTTSLAGLCWFQLMVGATYLGVASALVELLMNKRGAPETHLAQLAIELEGAHQALLGTAYGLERQPSVDLDTYNRALCTRFSVQGAIERAASLATELLGGMSFIASDEVSYLLAATRGICFHPISRVAAAPALAEFLREHAATSTPVHA